jgi:hypothetical protein
VALVVPHVAEWRLTTASGRRIVACTSTLIVAIVTVSSLGTRRAYPEAGNRDCRADRLCYNRRPDFPACNRVRCAIEQALLAPARGPARMTNLWKNTGLWMQSKP